MPERPNFAGIVPCTPRCYPATRNGHSDGCAKNRAHLAAALNAEVDRWLADEGTVEHAARAMSGPYWWAEDDRGVGDEIRQSIRDDARAALAALTTDTDPNGASE